MHAYWRAANYLSVGQIYLMDNPLLKEKAAWAEVARMNRERGPRLRRYEQVAKHLIELLKPRRAGCDYYNRGTSDESAGT